MILLTLLAQPVFHPPSNPLLQPPSLQSCYKEATRDCAESLAEVQMNIHRSPLVHTASDLLGERNGVVPQIFLLSLLEGRWDLCLFPGAMNPPRSPGLFKAERVRWHWLPSSAPQHVSLRLCCQAWALGGLKTDLTSQKSRQEQH